MTKRRSVLTGLAALAIVLMAGAPAHPQDELQQIKSKGVLTFGVKADYPPVVGQFETFGSLSYHIQDA